MTTSRQIHYSGRPPYWKSFSGKISTIYRPINKKVVWRCRITLSHRSRDHNIKFSKSNMEDGRHFENGFIAISQPGIIRFQWNLVGLVDFESDLLRPPVRVRGTSYRHTSVWCSPPTLLDVILNHFFLFHQAFLSWHCQAPLFSSCTYVV